MAEKKEESSWLGDFFDTVADTGSGLVDAVSGGLVGAADAYAEREIEEIKNEPVNTANMPAGNDDASAIKRNEAAATKAVAEQKAAAAAALADGSFMDKYGKWLAIGGGSLVALGTVVLLAKGGGK